MAKRKLFEELTKGIEREAEIEYGLKEFIQGVLVGFIIGFLIALIVS
ncbi:MAG: hypothetical protein QXQ79_00500 [Candidatus Nanoarchaeia archaeon]